MVWHELTDNLEVVWGALAAFAIVVLLTPAVGGMARMLGVVDRPEGSRRATPRGVPRLGRVVLPAPVGVALTIVGIVAVMNMVNFLDGLDGLAAGVCAIAAFSFCLIDLSLQRPAAAILTATVFGACLGFLRHNFYPARIFMGDSGAMLLGFTLAAVSVQGLLKTTALATLVLPLLVLAVPVFDTSFVVAKRLRSKQPIYVADARHLHHRFMRIGFSEPRAVAYL